MQGKTGDLSKLRRRALSVYIGAVAVLASVIVVLLGLFRPFSFSFNLTLGIALLALICVAETYPISVAPKTKVSVTVAVVFASLLLFSPMASVIIAGGGDGIAQLLKHKKTWVNRLFDFSQVVCSTGLAALVYWGLGSLNTSPALVSAFGILRAVAAASVLYMVNSVGVSVAAGLQMRRNPAEIWWSGTKQSAVQELALAAIGLAFAMLAHEAPWAILLMLVPVTVIFYSFKSMAGLNEKVESQLQELKLAQSSLVESARMASIGTMMAGIAHQINNPMFVIHGRAEALVTDADEHLKTPYAKRAVQVIFEMADRVGRIINALMPSAQSLSGDAVSSDVNEALKNIMLLLEPKFMKSGVQVNSDFGENVPVCPIDPSELQELLLNIMDNACNAMPDGGKLILTTRSSDSGVSIRISDTGIGIAPDVLAKLFNPFFTTRKGSGGVGLGLYVSKHIAEKYRGKITVESHIGVGTVFTIILPAVSKKVLITNGDSQEANLVASGIGNPRRGP